MLPNLSLLRFKRGADTGGTLAPGQSPEDVVCVICLHSLAKPPPDVWPFDDDQPIWIVACTNRHAFHKGCLRAYARDSENPSWCPECRDPILPQVLTQVSRPSTGKHAAREAREARARARGQRRDAEDERQQYQRLIERMQQEELEMDDEERHMLDDAYGDGYRNVDPEEDARQYMEVLQQQYDAARNDPSRERWDELSNTVIDITESCTQEGGEDFLNAFKNLMQNGNNETFFKNALARMFPNDMVIKGILIKLLSELMQDQVAESQGNEIRDMVRRWGIRDDVRRYAAHVNRNHMYPDPPSGERREYETWFRDVHMFHANRLLHYL